MFLVLALAGCADDTPPLAPQVFAPLHYEYLPKLRLNVASVAVTDHSLPVSPQDVASSSPVVPAQALQQMARDRLFAVGGTGTATFTIDQASIVREPGGALDGQLAVHLDLAAPAGTRTGFAEARIARQHVPGSEPEDGSANLYALTRQMMDAMNVELEYQVRQSLKPFVVEGAGAPAPSLPSRLPCRARRRRSRSCRRFRHRPPCRQQPRMQQRPRRRTPFRTRPSCRPSSPSRCRPRRASCSPPDSSRAARRPAYVLKQIQNAGRAARVTGPDLTRR